MCARHRGVRPALPPSTHGLLSLRTPDAVSRLDVMPPIAFWRTVALAAVLPGNTNDGFVGFDSETLRSGGSSKLTPPVWDAGETLHVLGSSLLLVDKGRLSSGCMCSPRRAHSRVHIHPAYGDEFRPNSVMFVSPTQFLLLPGSPCIDNFHVLNVGLPQGRDNAE